MQNIICNKSPYWRRIQTAIRHSSVQNGETYYDILKVQKNCSNQEIRNAFVQLSKKFHPDVKGITPDPKQTAQFVKISEAYQILSKPKSRSAYDQRLWDAGVLRPGQRSRSGAVKNMHSAEIHRPWEIKPNFDPNPGPYYGVKGLERVSNLKVAIALAVLGIAGAIFGFVSVNTYYFFSHSFTFNRQKLDAKSAEAGIYHAAIRADAEKYGNEEQLRRMLNRMSKDER
ncbi:dnaJ-like protein 60 isoform X1 [Bactrocera neohumeralis]|uniref:dnaJ-like protein 60 isoform X1 n=1 Tax=Bactrocera tryoni TaxID=59916 RepID=UPI001A95B5D1|nr:dnaJ-like protein 60 isoform X1 [Bactrocera tryoni]XP_050323287.1 dnaJ-like protein 60 isoform X1 [Bactrocera neohumeralis]